MINRYLHQRVAEDLRQKMVFISGPRQVGKTTLAKQIAKELYPHFQYLNWDESDHRSIIHDASYDPDAKLVIFDEIHKFSRWKNYLKGKYDVYHDRFSILVTGSAKLDVYRRGGDSLMGRYYAYRLHPLSVAEILGIRPKISLGSELHFGDDRKSPSVTGTLLHFGGFPEPFRKQDDRELKRWHQQRRERLIREDIREIETIRDLSVLELLVRLLPPRVGSLLSLHNLAQELEVSFGTVKLWMNILEKFYYHFRISPFHGKLMRSLRKEQKMYLWDWSEVVNSSARLENLVASHLLKWCHYLHDAEGENAELWYLRDRQGREVDFLVTVDSKPWFCVEVKESVRSSSADHLDYFGERMTIPYRYLVTGEQGVDFLREQCRVMSVEKFLGGLV